MTDYPWYKDVPSEAPLSQGDLLESCPVVRWDDTEALIDLSPDTLRGALVSEAVDCVVMTQACDLEQGHVRDVILCPTYQLSVFQEQWAKHMESKGQTPSQKAWKNLLKDVRDSRIWNLAMINECRPDAGSGTRLQTEIRVVDFHEIFSVPKAFLETWLRNVNSSRLTLLPPYREHLSQAFARYFMRVGLPLNVEPRW